MDKTSNLLNQNANNAGGQSNIQPKEKEEIKSGQPAKKIIQAKALQVNTMN